jgi:hypothetical protein
VRLCVWVGVGVWVWVWVGQRMMGEEKGYINHHLIHSIRASGTSSGGMSSARGAAPRNPVICWLISHTSHSCSAGSSASPNLRTAQATQPRSRQANQVRHVVPTSSTGMCGTKL